MALPVVRACAYSLAHVPGLVRHGSKPSRELALDPDLEPSLRDALRSFEEAAAYPPNQVFLGNLTPRELGDLPRPWFETQAGESSPRGRFGDIVSQGEFYRQLQRADILCPPLVDLDPSGDETSGSPDDCLPLYDDEHRHVGWCRRDLRSEGRDDTNLIAPILLENLCSKASGALAMEHLFDREGMDPAAVDFVIGCGEEACGDRYQRGGGGMAKALAEMCGCTRASGMDVKNFCAAPASALVTAGALVAAGLHERIVVVGGGSLAKLGMKIRGFLEAGIPVLDDCLAAVAFLVTADDGESPRLVLEKDAVGMTPTGASTSEEAVYREFVMKPLRARGLRLTDIDKFAPELHNPEIMEFAGSGDVAHKNYRSLAALGVLEGEISRDEMEEFSARVGMPGFAPTQGHIPSGVSFLGHACRFIRAGQMRHVMFLSKASLFLNRCTRLYDGVSFFLEPNNSHAAA